MAKNFVRKIKDINGHTIMLHRDIKKLYDKINDYIFKFEKYQINEKELNNSVNSAIVTFMDIYNIDFDNEQFTYLYSDDESDNESDNE